MGERKAAERTATGRPVVLLATPHLFLRCARARPRCSGLPSSAATAGEHRPSYQARSEEDAGMRKHGRRHVCVCVQDHAPLEGHYMYCEYVG